MAASPAFDDLRHRLDHRFREASAAAFTQADETVVRSGIPELDRALHGGFTRGTIATLEGAPSSGRTAVAARLLAVATATGLGAVVGEGLFPPSLAAAGVRLERLLIVPVREPPAAARAADILLRSGAFGVVVVPVLPGGRGSSATWTRLASLAHRANALLVVLGVEASSELRYFASLRLETALERVRWNGPSGHLCELAGYDVRATVRKHKHAAPGGTARFTCLGFESRPAPAALRDRTLQESDVFTRDTIAHRFGAIEHIGREPDQRAEHRSNRFHPLTSRTA
jgi:hypothetical protein